MTDWRDISTAPRDGTNVLLYAAGDVNIGGWYEFSSGGVVHSGWTAAETCIDKPTHWMPLPEPPK